MSHLSIACIGTGYFSGFHYDAWHRINDTKLVAACSLSIEDAKKTGLPAYNNAEHMLKHVSPDIVDIITPPASHLDLISLCAEAGVKNIICQKPFCNSLSQAKAAIKICNANGARLIVHENFRFQPWFRKMKQVMDENLLGDIHQLTFRLRTGDGQGPTAYLDRQPYFQQMNKFLIRETGVHYIDTFRYLLGKPNSVYADLRKLNPAIAGEDAGYFIIEFDNARRALFDGNRHLDHDADNCRTTLGEALLEGSKGTLSLSGYGEVLLRRHGSNIADVILPRSQWNGFAGDCVYALQSHVAQGIKAGTTLENEAIDYLPVLEIESAIYQSTANGNKVAL